MRRLDGGKRGERESPARVFPAASRAELWAAGNSNGDGNGDSSSPHESQTSEFSLISSENDPEIVFNESPRRSELRSIDDLSAAFTRSGFGRGNNGQNL